MASCWRTLLAYRNYLIIYLVPLLFLALPLVINSKEASCAFVIILMALFWCFEALPLAVTALLPVLLFPMMGIMDSTLVCAQYLKDTNMLFIGGLLVAIAVEHWNLHKRIALRVLLIVGVKPALLMLGFMLVTAFLSMWISNTATTAMMVPIAQAVLDQLHTSEKMLNEQKAQKIKEAQESNELNGNVNKAFDLQEKSPAQTNLVCEVQLKPKPGDNTLKEKQSMELQERIVQIPELGEDQKESNGYISSNDEGVVLSEEENRLKEENHLKLCKGMSLCVCYSASIGGIATLTGTTPNLVLKGQMDELFPDNNNVINFASWFGFAFPTMLVLLAFSYLWLQITFLGFNFRKNFGCGVKPEVKAKQKRAYQVIRIEHRKLGSMTFAEICVLILFVLLVLLWFTREPGFMPGWATISFNRNREYVTDATVAIFISIMMFIFPSEIPTSAYRNSLESASAPASEGDGSEPNREASGHGPWVKTPLTQRDPVAQRAMGVPRGDCKIILIIIGFLLQRVVADPSGHPAVPSVSTTPVLSLPSLFSSPPSWLCPLIKEGGRILRRRHLCLSPCNPRCPE